MRTKLVSECDDQCLLEYCVGKAKKVCVYPGIQQCLAIAGWTPSGMLCTHVSPGATKAEIEATFDYLRGMGGDNARRWYVVGPCSEHFAAVNAQWRSVEAIKGSFRKQLKNKAADRWILDVTTERNQHSWGIDIQAETYPAHPAIAFAYRQAMKRGAWTNLKLHNFVRF